MSANTLTAEHRRINAELRGRNSYLVPRFSASCQRVSAVAVIGDILRQVSVRQRSRRGRDSGEVTKSFVSRNFLERNATAGDSPVGENEQPS